MKNKNKKRQHPRLVKCITIILIALLLIAAMVALLYFFELRSKPKEADSESEELVGQYLEYDGKKYYLRDDVETVLVMGTDAYGAVVDNTSEYNKNYTDFMMLLVFDHKNKTCSAVHINRDTMAKMAVLDKSGNKIDEKITQITLAYGYAAGADAGAKNAMETVSNLFCGIPIDRYVLFTTSAIHEVNNLVGGVTVEVLHDGLDHYDTTLKKGTVVTLTDKQAEYYVRSRWHIEGHSNVARMERQRQYLDALLTKAKTLSAANSNFSAEALVALSSCMKSNCTPQKLNYFFELAQKYTVDNEIKTYDGALGQNSTTEYMEFYAYPDSIKAIITRLLYKTKE